MFAKDYRDLARENLRGNWKLSVIAGMLACLLGGLITGSSFIPNININLDKQSMETLYQQIPFILKFAVVTGSITSVLSFVYFILGGVIQLGYAQYLLNQHDRREFQLNDLFSKFDYFGVGFCQNFLRGLYVFLWSLLFVIPGIVAQYRYAMTPFIMAEHPELTASEAIRASKKMMDGNKWALFCLDFSFFGWALLSALTLNIGNLWLNPYRNAAYAAFYRRVSVSDPYNEM